MTTTTRIICKTDKLCKVVIFISSFFFNDCKGIPIFLISKQNITFFCNTFIICKKKHFYFISLSFFIVFKCNSFHMFAYINTPHISSLIPFGFTRHFIVYHFAVYFQIFKTYVLYHPFRTITSISRAQLWSAAQR